MKRQAYYFVGKNGEDLDVRDVPAELVEQVSATLAARARAVAVVRVQAWAWAAAVCARGPEGGTWAWATAACSSTTRANAVGSGAAATAVARRRAPCAQMEAKRSLMLEKLADVDEEIAEFYLMEEEPPLARFHAGDAAVTAVCTRRACAQQGARG